MTLRCYRTIFLYKARVRPRYDIAEVPNILNGTSRHASLNSISSIEVIYFNLLSNFVPEGGNGTEGSKRRSGEAV